ncbi:hypothetical protein [Zoogloea sp.]|uniref:hypothetical protein n=1 Tax=Zoogloea sp. TaxID=49181 RepID=UPI0026370AC6|nr:hypothetical protein [uncultured Zoogloea sp.]
MSLKAALLTLITSLFLMISNGTQAQSAGEQPSLRGYTGQALGKTLAETLKLRSLGVATNTSSTCASFASAIGSAAFAPGPQRKALSLIALDTRDDTRPVVDSFREKDGVALIFGGQTSAEENYALTKAMLSGLARRHYAGALFIHQTVWLSGQVTRAADEDPILTAYLAAKSNLYTASRDAVHEQVWLHQVQVRDGEQTFARAVGRIPTTRAAATPLEHLQLGGALPSKSHEAIAVDHARRLARS